jgi:hypothetical protein
MAGEGPQAAGGPALEERIDLQRGKAGGGVQGGHCINLKASS